MEWKNILRTWKNVFSNWKYLSLAFFVALAFYLVNVLISNWKNLWDFYSSFGFFGTIKFFIVLSIGFKSLLKLNSYVSLIIISVLFGMLLSLIAYKIRINQSPLTKKEGFFGGLGLFLGAFIPGCPACGIGLASVLGVGAGFLTFLPYDGLEISLLSILILSLTLLKISNDMYYCNISKLTLKKMKGGKNE